ncbi:hypothetical protein GRI69_07580 [Erythrobacter vulgaris]|uniref:Uncharacterized protein n=1 Tax=Qipengyuania vulgaris TaxID=291985 RepID=A0A844XRS7_9SPHN|nr:hypothetical protein [Qipengyuania vulgaris]
MRARCCRIAVSPADQTDQIDRIDMIENAMRSGVVRRIARSPGHHLNRFQRP